MPPNRPQTTPSINANAEILTALRDLNHNVQRLNEYYGKLENRIQNQPAQPRIFRAEQNETLRRMGMPVPGEQASLFDPSAKPHVTYAGAQDIAREAAGQTQLFSAGAQTRYRDDNTWRSLPPDAPPSDPIKLRDKWDRSRTTRREAGFRAALGQMSGRIPWSEDSARIRDQGPGPDAYPPDSGGPDDPPQPGQTTSGGSSTRRPGGMNPNDPSMLTWAVMGEHGGPAFIRNLALEQWGLSRSLNWAQQNADNLQARTGELPNFVQRLGVNANNMQTVHDALSLAQDHPLATYAAYRAGRGMWNAGASAFSNFQHWQALGQQMGYGPPAAGGQNIFGHWNPLGAFGTAAQVGANYQIGAQALQGRIPGQGFGNGLNSQQAQETMETLAGQGFGMQPTSPILSTIAGLPGGRTMSGLLGAAFGSHPQGDAYTIGQNLFRPLMTANPQLSAQDIAQFTPELRYSGTSIQQLTDQLSGLGSAARETKETVGEFTSSVAATGETFASLGSSRQGGQGVGLGFSAATGLDPQVAGQLAQNPLFQGMAMSRFGVLPSGLGEMNPGAFATTGSQTIQMLSHALGGLNQNRYQMINGRRVLVEPGQHAVTAQISHMTGLSYNAVRQMQSDAGPTQARAQLSTALGDPTQGSGIWQFLNYHGGQNNKLSPQQYRIAADQWHATIDPYMRQVLGKKEAQQIDSHTGLRDRAKALQNAIRNAGKNDPNNQISNTPTNQTVYVQFKGSAAKYFEQVGGPSPNKQLANAGIGSTNSVQNSVAGDISGAIHTVGDLTSGNFSGAAQSFGNLMSNLNPF